MNSTLKFKPERNFLPVNIIVCPIALVTLIVRQGFGAPSNEHISHPGVEIGDQVDSAYDVLRVDKAK